MPNEIEPGSSSQSMVTSTASVQDERRARHPYKLTFVLILMCVCRREMIRGMSKLSAVQRNVLLVNNDEIGGELLEL